MRFSLSVPFALLVAATAASSAPQDFETEFRASMQWRAIGPSRGGRSAAVTGIPGNRDTFYMGACGGGVWKTSDGGRSWKNVSDGFFGGSIGAVAVSEWDPNVVYVGGGEVTVRGNVSHGDGVWKSTDAGKTWKHVGLADSRRIPRIRIHPRDPDVVYAAVLGHLFGPNEERGVYRSLDGGKSWKRVLYVNEHAGACDLILDPSNPRVIYASTWRVKRTPYSLESGGEGSGLWKSTDAGDTWTELTRNKGLPKETVGIIGIAISAARPDRVYAQIEAGDGGVFRSEDGGDTWTKVNSERKLRQRAWYYTRICADPENADVLYALNVQFHRSQDGGKTFTTISTPHGDNHDLWIDPNDPKRMIEANDGGANISYDGGANWSRQDNQPTAQFYRVTTDNHFPYRIYGAQQDNSTVRIAHRSDSGSIGLRDWEPTAGGESGHIAVHPKDPDIVYGGSYSGLLVRRNHRTGESRRVDVWPDNPMGWGAAELRYRFQWNFPIFFSPHDPGVLYTAAQALFKTTDEGASWTAISGDLTRNDKSKMEPSGGPITKDNTSVEYYGTIFAACESPRVKGLLWCGSDDGLIHVSRDGGKQWTNVTPKRLPEWAMINSIEPHPFADGGLYVAATMYKSDDFRPYLYKTTDYGQTWTKIVTGIAGDHFTRVIRADPKRRGLLFCGTERGVYVSFDDGVTWAEFNQNLPVVPVTDLAIKNDDLIAATQGRSFWMIDDITAMRQVSRDVAESDLWLFAPRPTYRMRGGRGRREGRDAVVGANPAGGVQLRFWVKEPGDKPVSLEIIDPTGGTVRTFSSKAKKPDDKLKVEPGVNVFAWDMRYPGAVTFPGMILWAGGTGGPLGVPGTYRARLTHGDEVRESEFVIAADPRSSTGLADYTKQFEFMIGIRDKLSEIHQAILDIRELRSQLDALQKRAKAHGEGKDAVAKPIEDIKTELEAVEKALYQTKNQSRQDPLNFPIRLNNKLSALAGVAGNGSYAPTKQVVDVFEALVIEIDAELAKFRAVLRDKVPALNRLVEKHGIPSVVLSGKGLDEAAQTDGK